jgi:feruloyl-CoA synthase
MTAPKFRPLTFGVTRVVVRDGAPGVRYVKAEQALQDHPPRLTDRLQHWAQTAPERTFMARRVKRADGSSGDWRHVTYREAWASARAIAQGLINRGLSAERPVVILSENDLEHALLALGCLVAGVPYVPTSPPYSLISTDYSKLRHVLDTVTPGLVFAADGARYGKAIQAVLGADVEVVLTQGALPARANTAFADLLATPVTPAVDAAMQATGPDTITKFLFTSGSTKLPKAVINTQRMWCANQQQMAQSMPVLTEGAAGAGGLAALEPHLWRQPQLRHGGYNGGTMYIDDGKPTPALIGETLRNLREIAPTVYFNVPTGFEAIASAMKTDAALRKNFLSRVRMFFYAGAALAQPVWDSLYESEEARDRRAHRHDGRLGMTESGPFGLFVTSPNVKAGDLGLPTPGLELKLVDMDGKSEVRYRGPNITPGYWRPAETAEAFRRGRLLLHRRRREVDRRERPAPGPALRRPHRRGFQARHRHLRQRRTAARRVIAAGAPYVQDVVITGLNMQRSRRAGVPQRHGLRDLAICRPTPLSRRCSPARRARPLPGHGGPPGRSPPPAAPTASRACACWPSRRLIDRARSPTRARSTSAPCWRTVPIVDACTPTPCPACSSPPCAEPGPASPTRTHPDSPISRNTPWPTKDFSTPSTTSGCSTACARRWSITAARWATSRPTDLGIKAAREA